MSSPVSGAGAKPVQVPVLEVPQETSIATTQTTEATTAAEATTAQHPASSVVDRFTSGNLLSGLGGIFSGIKAKGSALAEEVGPVAKKGLDNLSSAASKAAGHVREFGQSETFQTVIKPGAAQILNAALQEAVGEQGAAIIQSFGKATEGVAKHGTEAQQAQAANTAAEVGDVVVSQAESKLQGQPDLLGQLKNQVASFQQVLQSIKGSVDAGDNQAAIDQALTTAGSIAENITSVTHKDNSALQVAIKSAVALGHKAVQIAPTLLDKEVSTEDKLQAAKSAVGELAQTVSATANNTDQAVGTMVDSVIGAATSVATNAQTIANEEATQQEKGAAGLDATKSVLSTAAQLFTGKQEKAQNVSTTFDQAVDGITQIATSEELSAEEKAKLGLSVLGDVASTGVDVVYGQESLNQSVSAVKGSAEDVAELASQIKDGTVEAGDVKDVTGGILGTVSQVRTGNQQTAQKTQAAFTGAIQNAVKLGQAIKNASAEGVDPQQNAKEIGQNIFGLVEKGLDVAGGVAPNNPVVAGIRGIFGLGKSLFG